MFGDCDRCGHSIIYHVPVAGCLKCSCGEFRCNEPSTNGIQPPISVEQQVQADERQT